MIFTTVIANISEINPSAVSPFLAFLLSLAVLILAAKLMGALAVKIGQPAVLGELLAGLILGPTFINLLSLPIFVDAHLEESLHHLGEIGVIILMATAGLEVELSDLRRAGLPASLAGILGVVIPLSFGTGLGMIFGLPTTMSIFLGLVLSATSVSISAQTLYELGHLRSKEGITLLGAAVIDDILVIMFLSGFIVVVSGEGSMASLLLQLGKMLLVLALATFFSYLLMPRIAKLSAKLRISEGLLAITLSFIFFLAWSTEFIGSVAAITGAFIAGLGLRSSHYREEIESGLHSLGYGFFIPLFLINIGLQANIGKLDRASLIFALSIIIIAVLSKIIGSGLGAWMGGAKKSSALRIGVGMVSRGEVGLIVARIGITEGIIQQDQFTLVIIMILATTFLTPVLLRWLYSKREVVDGTNDNTRGS